MASAQLDPGWWKKNAPALIANGAVTKALSELVKLKADLKKEKDPTGYLSGLENLAKTAVPKDEGTAKKEKDKDTQKDALKILADIKGAADHEREEVHKQALTVVSTFGEGIALAGRSALAVPAPKAKDTASASTRGSRAMSEGRGTVDTVVNLAKEAWAIVKDNTPCAAAKSAYCQAMPDKSQLSWEDLSGWKTDSAHWQFRWTTKLASALNSAPTNVIDFTVQYQWNGQCDKAAGLFLQKFAVWCKQIDVSWGWIVNVDATTQGKAFNAGSKDQPVGAIQLGVSLQVKSSLQSFGREWTITCAGDGSRKVV